MYKLEKQKRSWSCSDVARGFTCVFKEGKFFETKRFISENGQVDETARKDMQQYLYAQHLKIVAGKQDERKRIGAQIREVRVSKGMGLEEFSQQVGVRESTICRIEEGKLSVNFDLLQRIAEALDGEVAINFYGESKCLKKI